MQISVNGGFLNGQQAMDLSFKPKSESPKARDPLSIDSPQVTWGEAAASTVLEEKAGRSPWCLLHKAEAHLYPRVREQRGTARR